MNVKFGTSPWSQPDSEDDHKRIYLVFFRSAGIDIINKKKGWMKNPKLIDISAGRQIFKQRCRSNSLPVKCERKSLGQFFFFMRHWVKGAQFFLEGCASLIFLCTSWFGNLCSYETFAAYPFISITQWRCGFVGILFFKFSYSMHTHLSFSAKFVDFVSMLLVFSFTYLLRFTKSNVIL